MVDNYNLAYSCITAENMDILKALNFSVILT